MGQGICSINSVTFFLCWNSEGSGYNSWVFLGRSMCDILYIKWHGRTDDLD